MKYLFTALWYCVCVLSCIDTKQFIYASMSQTLYPSVIGLLMVIVLGLICICRKRTPGLSIAQIPAIILAVYMILHGIIIKDPEIYKQGYFVSTLLFMVVLAQSVRMNIMEDRHLEYGILLIAATNVFYLLAQGIGLLDSNNPFFSITGTTDNPNTAAIALTISIPFIIQKIVSKKHVGSMCLLLVAVLGFIIILKCRTAYLGITCIIAYLVLRTPRFKQAFLNMMKSKAGFFQMLGILLALIALLLLCYNWKKESADGRLFIWQRNCEIIMNNPLGCGYGKYEVEYNLYQSHYFANHKEAYLQNNLATASSSAYNDILEQGVQGGVIGGALYLLFLLSSVWQAYRNDRKACSAALVAVIIMSMTNSINCGISPWIMTIATVAIGTADSKKQLDVPFLRSAVICLVFALSVFLLGRNAMLLVSQSTLRGYKNGQNYNLKDIEKLYPAIGTSEVYWRYRAECNEKANNDLAADSCYYEARKYTSTPLLLFNSSICKERIRDYDSAHKLLETAVFMLPRNFSLKYHLMKMYDRTGYMNLARSVAEEIITSPVKKHNESVEFIKEEAQRYLSGEKNTRITY